MNRNRSFDVHAGWGAVIVLALVMAGVPLTLAFMASFAAGIAVELVQWVAPRFGQADVMDVIWTGAGAAGAAAYVMAIGG